MMKTLQALFKNGETFRLLKSLTDNTIELLCSNSSIADCFSKRRIMANKYKGAMMNTMTMIAV